METSIQLSFDNTDRAQPVFQGTGEVLSFCSEEYPHMNVDYSVPDELVIKTPNGELTAPDETNVLLDGCLNSRCAYRNHMILENDESNSLLIGKISVKIPVTPNLLIHGGLGDYEMTIPITLTMKETYGSYDKDLRLTTWDDLVEEGRVALDDTGKLSKLPSDNNENEEYILELPPEVKNIAAEFKNTDYKIVTIPPTVVSGMPFQLSGVEKITFDPGIKTIPYGFCAHARNLKKVEIPEYENMTFENYSFMGCWELENMTMPKNVTLGCSVFSQCYALKKVVFRESVSVKADVRSYNYAPFQDCGLEELRFEEGLKSIPHFLCNNCENLEDLYLPYTLSYIGQRAFMDLPKLDNVVIRSDIQIPDSKYSGAFENVAIENVHVEDGVTFITDNMFKNSCSVLKAVHLPEGIKTIGNDAFSGCELLESLYLPSSITCMGARAFGGCKNLKEIVIRSNITLPRSTVVSPFEGSGLERIVFDDNATAVYANFFRNGCSKVTEIDLGNVNYLEGDAFGNCTSLKEITITGNIISGRSNVVSPFRGGNLEKININEGVTATMPYMFAGACANMKEIVLPTTLETLNIGTFSGCSALESVYLPESLKNIGQDVFRGCVNLKELNINSTLSKIGSASQSPVSDGGVVTVNIKDGVTTLNRMYLANGKGETITIRIPGSVKTINYDVFMYKESYRVEYAGTRAEWDAVVKDKSFTPVEVVCADDEITVSGIQTTTSSAISVSALMDGFDEGIRDMGDTEDSNEVFGLKESDQRKVKEEKVGFSDERNEVTTGGATDLNSVKGEEVEETDRRGKQSDTMLCSIGSQDHSDGASGCDEGLSEGESEREQNQTQDSCKGETDSAEASGERCGTNFHLDIG